MNLFTNYKKTIAITFMLSLATSQIQAFNFSSLFSCVAENTGANNNSLNPKDVIPPKHVFPSNPTIPNAGSKKQFFDIAKKFIIDNKKTIIYSSIAVGAILTLTSIVLLVKKYRNKNTNKY